MEVGAEVCLEKRGEDEEEVRTRVVIRRGGGGKGPGDCARLEQCSSTTFTTYSRARIRALIRGKWPIVWCNGMEWNLA